MPPDPLRSSQTRAARLLGAFGPPLLSLAVHYLQNWLDPLLGLADSPLLGSWPMAPQLSESRARGATLKVGGGLTSDSKWGG